MYIIAIGWSFVVLVLTLAQDSILAEVMTLLFWGVLPLSLLLWIIGTPARHKNRLLHDTPDELPTPEPVQNETGVADATPDKHNSL